METEQKIVVTCGGMDGQVDASVEWIKDKVYLDVCINDSHVSGWVTPSVAAIVKGLNGQVRVDSPNVIDDLTKIGMGMEAAGKAMRAATAEVSRQKLVIDQYRSGNTAHENLIGSLYELLQQESDSNYDTAYSLVLDAYRAIHGPRD